MSRFVLSRRSFFKRVGGFALALPFLEAHAQTVVPRRYLLGFAGCSLGGYDGNIANTFVPTTVGANYDLNAALRALGAPRTALGEVSGEIPGLR